MVSFGGGGGSSKQKSKSQNESKTVFPGDFFNDARAQFGPMPEYDPEYIGLGQDDFNRFETTLYDSTKNKATDAYRGALNLQNEDLSNMGLLNSPSKFIEGGARDTLNKGYLSTLQQAASPDYSWVSE